MTIHPWSRPRGAGSGRLHSGFWYLRVVLPILAAAVLTPVQADDSTARASGNPLWEISLSALTATIQRPLFSPSRQPPRPVVPSIVAVPAPAASPRPVEPDHPLLTLMGTIAGERVSMAIFVDDATKNVIRLMAGQNHGGWTLRSVRGRQVEFEKEHRTAKLILPRDGPQTISATDSDVLAHLTPQRRRGGRSH